MNQHNHKHTHTGPRGEPTQPHVHPHTHMDGVHTAHYHDGDFVRVEGTEEYMAVYSLGTIPEHSDSLPF